MAATGGPRRAPVAICSQAVSQGQSGPDPGPWTARMFVMGSQRRESAPEYKDEAVKLVINTGRPVAVVARELGVQESTLGRWVNLYKSRQDAGDGALSETERAELARLRKENSELKMDRAFLKKASLFFAQEASDTNEKRSH